jgi:uncharacterized repeat protein (TIGR01451 family)
MAGMLLIGILVGASIPVPSVFADSPGVDSSDSAGTGSINSTDAVEGMNVTSMRDTQDTKDSTATDQDSRNPIDDKDEVDIEIDGDSNSFDNNSIQIIYNNDSSTGDSDDSGESNDSDDSVFGDSSTDSDDFDDSDDSVFGDSSTDSDNFNDSDDFNESDDSVFNNSSAERFDDTINESNDSDSEDAFSVGSSSTVNNSNVADLQLNKTVNYDRISTGNHTSENVTVQFTIQVTNTGPAEATGIMIEDDSLTRTLTDESGFLYLSNTQSQGNYIPSNGTWSVGALETGETATLTVEAAVVGANETLTNTAEITVSDQFDPDSTLDNSDSAEDDQDSASVTIIGSVRKSVFKSLATPIRVSG